MIEQPNNKEEQKPGPFKRLFMWMGICFCPSESGPEEEDADFEEQLIMDCPHCGQPITVKINLEL